MQNRLEGGFQEWEAAERALAEAHATLAGGDILVPVRLRGYEGHLFARCDLASLAENRLGETEDPWRVGRRTVERWRSLALLAPLRPPPARKKEICYWITRQGNRVGTLALSRFCLGRFAVLSSVYLLPSHRGRGIMGEAVHAVRSALEARGLGLGLDTSWCWQSAVRFHLRNGFWLRSWKRDLAFYRTPYMPPPVIGVEEGDAWLGVELEGRRIVLARARRDGDTLVKHGVEPDLPSTARHLEAAACTTLSLAIALRGWPLVRPHEHWDRRRHSDLVHPEALAHRIPVWEAWTRWRGWRVDTPRIAGLGYPSWEELDSGG